jgi:hypothetical protein
MVSAISSRLLIRGLQVRILPGAFADVLRAMEYGDDDVVRFQWPAIILELELEQPDWMTSPIRPDP